MAERFHRIRFYEKVWSTLDAIERCGKPGYCVGCEFNHPLCTENGKLIAVSDTPAKHTGEE